MTKPTCFARLPSHPPRQILCIYGIRTVLRNPCAVHVFERHGSAQSQLRFPDLPGQLSNPQTPASHTKPSRGPARMACERFPRRGDKIIERNVLWDCSYQPRSQSAIKTSSHGKDKDTLVPMPNQATNASMEGQTQNSSFHAAHVGGEEIFGTLYLSSEAWRSSRDPNTVL